MEAEARTQKTIYLVATDGSEQSAHAIEVACDLGARLGGPMELHIIHAVEVLPTAGVMGMGPPIPMVDLLRLGREILTEACAIAAKRATGGVIGHLASGKPWSEIVKTAAAVDAGLVIIATAGRTGVAHMLLGSVAEKVVRHAGCPVLVVRPKHHDVANAPAIDPPCPDCTKARAAEPARPWCERHAAHHPHGRSLYELPEPFAIGSMNFRP